MNTHKSTTSFARRLCARICSAFIWNRDARKAFRNALMSDYKEEIQTLRTELLSLRIAHDVSSERNSMNCVNGGGYIVVGKDNRIILIENGQERTLKADERIPGMDISICGNNNEIRIHRPNNFCNVIIQIGCCEVNAFNNDVRIEIHQATTMHNVFLRCISGEKQVFRFGKRSRIWGAKIYLDETSGCIIGDDCNCSDEIRIWGSDGHAILDKTDLEKILNEVKGPVTIGNNCWIGQAVRLLKNARVPDNTIVSGGAIVTKAFSEEYTCIAGSPAKVIKHGVIRSPMPDAFNPYMLKKSRAQKNTRPQD